MAGAAPENAHDGTPDYAPSADLLFSGLAPAAPDLLFGAAAAGAAQPYNPSADLLFDALAPATANLQFDDGAGSGDADAPNAITLAATLPPLQAAVQLAPSVPAVLAAPMPGMVCTAQAAYASNTARPVVSKAGSSYQSASALQAGVGIGQQGAAAMPVGRLGAWQRAADAGALIFLHLPQTLFARPLRLLGLWQGGMATRAATGFAHQDARAAKLFFASGFQNGQGLRCGTHFKHQDASRAPRRSAGSHWQGAAPRVRVHGHHWQPASAQPLGWHPLWQNARPPRVGVWAPPSQPPKPPPCYTPSAALVFDALAAIDALDVPVAHLLFACPKNTPQQPPATVVVAIKGAYIVLNAISLKRIDNNAQLLVTDFGMSLDCDSWTWRWQATVADHSAQHLNRQADGSPAELLATINGAEYRLRLELATRNRAFMPTTWSISGRGRNAILDAPYAPARSFAHTGALTAQQLAEDVLTENGIGLGWAVDWQLDDWNPPAGAWSVQGSYMQALVDIAQAAGGMVQPHATDQTIRILPRYRAAPWNWASLTPDIELPDAAVLTEGIETLDKPAYNRVFVGGTTAGVFGPYTRTGTAGDLLAPQATHALIGDATAHHQRGLAELSDTGRQEHITLRLQVLPEAGIIEPAHLVRYTATNNNTHSPAQTRLGIVRSTQVQWQESGAWQTIKLETHI